MQWKAIYQDGTALDQFKSDGTENKYTDIDRSRLTQFLFIHNNKPVLVIHLDAAKRLIYRKRVAMNMLAQVEEIVYIAGWQENRNGVNLQSVCFLFEDGHIEVVDRFYEQHPWFYPINFRPEEKL